MIWTSFSFNLQWLVNTHDILGSNKKWLVYTSYGFCSWSRQWNMFKSGEQVLTRLQRLLNYFTDLYICNIMLEETQEKLRSLALASFLLPHFLHCVHICYLRFCRCGLLFILFIICQENIQIQDLFLFQSCKDVSR